MGNNGEDNTDWLGDAAPPAVAREVAMDAKTSASAANVMSFRPLGSGIGSSNSRCQPLAVNGFFLTKRGGGRART
jgi:hypothetical protein